jgi:putative hemolysin
VVLRVAPLLAGLRLVLAPLALVAHGATRLVDTLILGHHEPELPGTSDFKTAIASQSSLGTYHAVELALLHDVIDFGMRRARNLMVPRVDVTCLDVNDSTAEWVATMVRHPFRVYPVVDGSPDNIVGCVPATRVLIRAGRDEGADADRSALIEAALFAPVTIGAEQLVENMTARGAPLAVLLDEYGGMAGVVGMSSLTQSVLGEIAPLTGLGNPTIERRDNGTLVVRGDCPLHILEDEAGLPFPSRRADTVAGALAEMVGRVPRVGDEVRLPGWRLRVASMQGRRLLRVIVRPSADGEAP